LNGKSRFITDATVNLFLIIGEKRCGQAFVGVSVGDKKVFFSPLKESSEKFWSESGDASNNLNGKGTEAAEVKKSTSILQGHKLSWL
jgi:hypothetical protein